MYTYSMTPNHEQQRDNVLCNNNSISQNWLHRDNRNQYFSKLVVS